MYLSTFKRIQEYVDEADIAPVPTLQSDEARIKIDNATFQWGTASIPTLKNINLDVCRRTCSSEIMRTHVTIGQER